MCSRSASDQVLEWGKWKKLDTPRTVLVVISWARVATMPLSMGGQDMIPGEELTVMCQVNNVSCALQDMIDPTLPHPSIEG